jgi:hypothetical protein
VIGMMLKKAMDEADLDDVQQQIMISSFFVSIDDINKRSKPQGFANFFNLDKMKGES